MPESDIVALVLSKAAKCTEHFGDFCNVNQGLRTGNNDKYLSKVDNEAPWRKVISGADISPYSINEKLNYVYYVRSDLDAPRRESLWNTKEKLFFQEVRNITLERRIIGAFDCEGLIGLQTTNVVTIKDPHTSWCLQSLLAVVASDIVNIWFKNSYRGNNHISGAQLRSIPIPPASDADKTKLAALAEQCAEAAAADDQASLAIHEAEINQIVYRLFDLTEEEIHLIESSLETQR